MMLDYGASADDIVGGWRGSGRACPNHGASADDVMGTGRSGHDSVTAEKHEGCGKHRGYAEHIGAPFRMRRPLE